VEKREGKLMPKHLLIIFFKKAILMIKEMKMKMKMRNESQAREKKK